MMLGQSPFTQHHHRLHLVQFLAGGVPKIRRHKLGDVATEPVYPHILHPPAHHIDHILAERSVRIVKVCNITPIFIGGDDGSLFVLCVPIRVFRDKRIVPCRVIGNKINNQLHAVLVHRPQKVLEIFHRPELRIHAVEIFDRVGRAQPSLPLLLANRMNGHKP